MIPTHGVGIFQPWTKFFCPQTSSTLGGKTRMKILDFMGDKLINPDIPIIRSKGVACLPTVFRVIFHLATPKRLRSSDTLGELPLQGAVFVEVFFFPERWSWWQDFGYMSYNSQLHALLFHQKSWSWREKKGWAPTYNTYFFLQSWELSHGLHLLLNEEGLTLQGIRCEKSKSCCNLIHCKGVHVRLIDFFPER